MSPPRPLSGRRIVISGAARGLGRALAITAADRGADLVLLGRSQSALALLGDTIEVRTGRRCEYLSCDLSHPESISQACQQTLAAAPVVDVLVNNACPWLAGDLESLHEADIVATATAAVSGTILITKGLLPGLRRSAAADIVTVVSTAGLSGHSRDAAASTVFHAAKHAQAGFHERLHAEMKKYNIRTSAIYPPDFDDADPLGTAWDAVRDPRSGAKLTNREVVEAILFAVTAPRVCSYTSIVLDNMSPD
jgi:short-subunit dehydrogenase